MGRRYDTISFLSDLGVADEHVGVVKAIVRDLAPHAQVVDLTHGIAAVRRARRQPRAGPGHRLRAVGRGAGVVDAGEPPALVAIEVADGEGVVVGPDNGLLASAVSMAGGAGRAVAARQPRVPPGQPGRDRCPAATCSRRWPRTCATASTSPSWARSSTPTSCCPASCRCRATPTAVACTPRCCGSTTSATASSTSASTTSRRGGRRGRPPAGHRRRSRPRRAARGSCRRARARLGRLRGRWLRPADARARPPVGGRRAGAGHRRPGDCAPARRGSTGPGVSVPVSLSSPRTESTRR